MHDEVYAGGKRGAYGKPLCGAYGEGTTAATKRREKKKIFGAQRPHFHRDKLRRRSTNEGALRERRGQWEAERLRSLA